MECLFYRKQWENKCAVFTETPMGGVCSPDRFSECKYCLTRQKYKESKEKARQNYIKQFGVDEYGQHGYSQQGLTDEQLRAKWSKEEE